ncbi:MAG TPA: CPBP family intramembrane glutamic endopeptidase, partial [Longimicrobiaceae bacterium]|nr:CPBP family intramembrane glutamic endopeptidase [Longimicrobiaceae bacterium]
MSALGPARSGLDDPARHCQPVAGEALSHPLPEPLGPKELTRGEALALALVVAIAAHAIPAWHVFGRLWTEDALGFRAVPWRTFRYILFLLFGLLLTLPTRRRSGLVLGDIRSQWRRVLLVCGGPVLITALVYPLLPVRPFANAGFQMWAISPLAQSLVFIGYIYGRLDTVFSDFVHPRLPVRQSLVITAGLFALWHVPGFWSLPAGYALFQLFYTSVA